MFNSVILKKVVMAGSGLIMVLFLIGHLIGNLLLYVGKAEFNAYADFLNSTKLLIVAEAVLSLALILHVITAIQLTRLNKKARPVPYHFQGVKSKATWMSSHMLNTGLVTFVFIVVHLWTFKFGNWNNGIAGNSLYDLVLYRFQDWVYSLGYGIAMLFLGFHLHHAIKSAFQTLGLTTANKEQWIARISAGSAWVLALGFFSFPCYFFFSQL